MDLNLKAISSPLTAIFIGRSGCGKGTQAKLLIEEIKKRDSRELFYLETGQSFRNFIATGNYSANLSKVINEAGGLQPEFLAVWAWAHLLVEQMKDDMHLVIDGTPRKPHEAQVFDSAMRFYKRDKPIIIYINVSPDWSRERLLARGRGDDNRDDIEARLKWFDSDVLPAIDFFRNNDNYRFVEVNGEKPVEEVFAELLEKVQL
jgi:adenylate kinase family enzyme